MPYDLRWGVREAYLTSNVAPGQLCAVNFTVAAPTNPGVCNFQWRMKQSGAPAYFGELTPNVAVSVASLPCAK